MKRTLWLVLCSLVALPATAELPATLDELKALHAEQGTTPEGALKLWFDACFVYMNEETREAGAAMLQYLTIPYMDEPEWFKLNSARTFVERLLDPAKQHIFRSYAKGTAPDNGYAMDPNDWELDHIRNNQREGDDRGIQCYVRSSGADTPRPVYLKQSTRTELWFVNVHANVYTDIRPPVDPNRETFR